MNTAWPSPYMASAHNRHLVLTPGSKDGIDFIGNPATGYDIAKAAEELHTKQALAAELGRFPVARELAIPVKDWTSLVRSMSNFVIGHLEQHDFEAYSKSPPKRNQKTDREKILVVANEGIATVGAFLAVIPKVCHVQNEQEPGPDLLRSARMSKGFIVAWYSMDSTDDVSLARALCPKTQRARTDEELFHNLSFDEKWFQGDPDGSVTLHDSNMDRLQQSLKSRRLSSRNNSRAVFGCPAARWIPPMYDMMADMADANGLFEATYFKHRTLQDSTHALAGAKTF